MAASKLLVLSTCIALIFTKISADASLDVEDKEEVPRSDGFVESSILKNELNQLKSEIHVLELRIDENMQELKGKDEIIAKKEKLIKEKSDNIALLQSEISSLQKKGTSDAQEQVGKAHAWAVELEKQLEKLKIEIQVKNKEIEALEVRTNDAEKKVLELNSKLGSVSSLIVRVL
ncbi:unnamed protein product [Ilex paraguariensis]|uniref:Uncharacterized protein n=1 Tax=Ilex paraguariensis TaxID=185542 RepID=A0ABC8UXW7_9AQUA